MAARPRDLLRGAALCAFAFVVLLALAYGSSGARHIDASALQGFFGLQRPRVSELTSDLAKLGDPLWVAAIAIVLAGVAALRRRLRLSLVVLALVAATSVSSQVLKALLAYPRESALDSVHPAPAAFPSGHSTAAMTIAIALVLVVPRRVRPLAAIVGAAIAVGVSFSVVSMGWHFPSDAIGGYLLACGWAFVLLAGLRAADLRWPARTGRSALARTAETAVGLVAGAGLAVAVVAGAVALVAVAFVLLVVRRADTLNYVDDHTAFVVVAILLALSVVALMAGLTRVLTRRA